MPREVRVGGRHEDVVLVDALQARVARAGFVLLFGADEGQVLPTQVPLKFFGQFTNDGLECGLARLLLPAGPVVAAAT